MLVASYNITTVFYAVPLGSGIEIDTIYAADSSILVAQNCWMNINAGQNDIRQILFGVFAMPFAIVATLLSYILFFIPNSYLVCLGVIQVGLVLASSILLTRMLRLKTSSRMFFLAMFSLSYPFLVFSFLVEQYIFVVFWLILFLHTSMFRRPHQDLLFVAATGSLLTSGFFFFLLSDVKKWKQWMFDNITVGLKFLIAVAIFGQFAAILTIVEQLNYLKQWGGVDLAFYEKFLIFINFIQACFIHPLTEIYTSSAQPNYPSYSLAPVDSLNVISLIFLLLAIAGFITNMKDRFSQICFTWIVASFLILCIAGWGTKGNSMGLYIYYFGWAYFCLVFLAIETLLQKLPAVKYTVYAACIAALAYINIPAMYDLIQFGVKYYPCP